MTPSGRGGLKLSELVQLSALTSVFVGVIVSIVTYIHADITIPKIMVQVERRIDERIDRHIKRDLGGVGDAVKELKDSTEKRFDRIESKLLSR